MISLDVEALRALIRDAVREALSSSPRADGYESVTEAAKRADVSPGTIRAWIKAGKLARYGAGRCLRVKRSELDTLLASPAESPEALARARFKVVGQ